MIRPGRKDEEDEVTVCFVDASNIPRARGLAGGRCGELMDPIFTDIPANPKRPRPDRGRRLNHSEAGFEGNGWIQ